MCIYLYEDLKLEFTGDLQCRGSAAVIQLRPARGTVPLSELMTDKPIFSGTQILLILKGFEGSPHLKPLTIP